MGQRSNEELSSVEEGANARVESRYESARDARGDLVQREERVYDDPNQRRMNLWSGLTMTIYFLLGLIEVLLGLRFLFRLLGASESSGFVRFLYDLTYPMAHPFAGIFTDPVLGNNSVFEVSTLIAMLIYALLAWGVVALIRLLLAPRRASRQSSMSTWRRMR
jgi:hypothetical protein